jgi:hypothetical protein
MPTTSSTSIPDDDMREILSDTVPLARCLPGKLFRVRMTPSKVTSDWSGVKSFLPTLTRILEITGGQQLTQRVTVKQLDTFLRAQTPPMTWSAADLDESIDFLRFMPESNGSAPLPNPPTCKKEEGRSRNEWKHENT